MYRGALRSMLSELVRRELLVVTDTLTIDAPRTRSLLEKLESFGTPDVLIVCESVETNLMLSARNLWRVAVCDVEGLNPLALLSREHVLMTAPALKKVEAWLS